MIREIETLEDTIKMIEMQFEKDPSGDNREKIYRTQAKLSRYLHLEEDY